ncbi:MAG: hypothetical protein MR620_07775 [Clostridiales bacterium]|nr:hypothetical protein [Clostridiales bacterium]
MAKNDNGNSIDFYELRRRHQQYQEAEAARRHLADQQAPAENAPQPEATEPSQPQTPPAPPVSEAAQDAPAQDVPAQDAPAQDVPAPEKASPEKTPVSPSEAEDEDPDEYDDEEGSTSFFKPMLGLAAKAVGKLRGLGSRKKETEEFLDDSDDGYEDEEPLPEKKGPFRLFRRRGQEEEDFGEYEQDEAGEESEAWQRPAEEAETEEIPQEEDVAEAPVSTPEEAADQAETEGAADIPDLPEDVPFEAADAPAADPDGADDEAYEDDEEFEEDAPARKSFGKRLLEKFIVYEGPEDEDEPIDEEDYEVTDPQPARPIDDSLFVNTPQRDFGEEERNTMEEQKKNTPESTPETKTDLTDLMAEGMGEHILSRRERRQLRMQQEGASQPQEEAEPASEMPAPDEPTREYQFVSRPGTEAPAREEAPETGRKDKKAARYEDDEDDYDDYDDEEEEEEKKPRFLKKAKKNKKAARYEDDEDDYDDFDDEEDEDDDYQAPSRGRKKAARYEDDEDDYDDYDDEYDDDYDDEDDDAPGAGHYVLGVLKVIIALALILVVAVFGMYFADSALDGGFKPYQLISEKVPLLNQYLPASNADAIDTQPTPAADADLEVTPEPAGDAEVTPEAAPVEDGASVEDGAPVEDGVPADEGDTGAVG